MTSALSFLQKLFSRRIARATQKHLGAISTEARQQHRSRVSALLRNLEQRPGPRVCLGETAWGQRVVIPLALLIKAFGIITGGTGSGKSMVAAILAETLLTGANLDLSFGIIDPKGELFERAFYLVGKQLNRLPAADADILQKRLVIIDLDSLDPITSCNIASPWSGGDLDYFATSRAEMLQELFPSGDGLSLRGASILKNVIKLLAERKLPFIHFDEVISSEPFRSRLTAASQDEELKRYFQDHFPNEGRATIAAVRARINATLLNSTSLKLALSGTTAPDFRALQDEGAIILIKCAGPNIPRATARAFQGLFLSDIRQAVFARRNQRPFLWILDEAQNFFRTKFLRDSMADLLQMARSFGTHCLFLTQNLSTAVQDSEMLEVLHSNIRWSLTLRGTAKDASFLQGALPVSGRRQKPRSNPYAPAEFYSPTEERALLMQDIASLRDRLGWLWLKSLTGEAFQLQTRNIDIPSGTDLKDAIRLILGDPEVGRRHRREDYIAEIRRRNLPGDPERPPADTRNLMTELTDLYQSGES